MVATFTATIFVAAFLLFFVQPLVARQVLPMLGGAASVWNACMLFFQAALLAGYGYAHLVTRLRRQRAQVLVHLGLVVLAGAFLPLRLQAASTTAIHHPVAWLLGVLALSVGPPFVLVAATSPLLQRWFSRSADPRAHDPYFLYAASNFGSLMALLAYPALVEPFFGLAGQTTAWALGYGALVGGLVATAVLLKPNTGPTTTAAAPVVASGDPESRFGVLRWLALAFVPSSLTLGVTAHMTADLGSLPFFWTVPLALYLLTFVIAFSRRSPPSARFLPAIPGLALFVAATVGQALETVPIVLAVTLHLAGFFFVALTCHARLAETRPAPHRLTAFYLWLATGGVLGGIFNAVVAPRLFSWPFEYPLVLALACLLRLGAAPARTSTLTRQGLIAAAFVVAALAWVAIARTLMTTRGLDASFAWFTLPLFGLALAALPRPIAFAALVAVLPWANVGLEGAARHQEVSRSFFGVHRVLATGERAIYRNGTTVHGMQNLGANNRCVPLTYYHPQSPVARAIGALHARHPIASAGLIGLGVGSLAPYARPGESWTFFEIDAAVARIAEDRRFFTFLSDCVAKGAQVQVHIGDGRVAVAAAAPRGFDLLVVDAFSSDVIPTHLVTREALALYRDRLSRNGVLLLHVSNRYYDLVPLLARAGPAVGLTVLRGQDLTTSEEEEAAGRIGSIWVAMLPPRPAAGPVTAATEPGPPLVDLLVHEAGFHPLAADATSPLWTDERSSLLSVIRFDALFTR